MALAPEQIAAKLDKRIWLENTRTELINERQSFLPHYRELGDNFSPRRQRYSTNDTNKGDRRNSKLMDGTGVRAARTLASGMQGGITSPVREWFSIGAENPMLEESHAVKLWLDDVNKIVRTTLINSNFYQATPTLYSDMGVFAT